MASVAGALADLAVKAMLNCGARTAVIENGGEVSAVSEIPVDVALLVETHHCPEGLVSELKSFQEVSPQVQASTGMP